MEIITMETYNEVLYLSEAIDSTLDLHPFTPALSAVVELQTPVVMLQHESGKLSSSSSRKSKNGKFVHHCKQNLRIFLEHTEVLVAIHATALRVNLLTNTKFSWIFS